MDAAGAQPRADVAAVVGPPRAGAGRAGRADRARHERAAAPLPGGRGRAARRAARRGAAPYGRGGDRAARRARRPPRGAGGGHPRPVGGGLAQPRQRDRRVRRRRRRPARPAPPAATGRRGGGTHDRHHRPGAGRVPPPGPRADELHPPRARGADDGARRRPARPRAQGRPRLARDARRRLRRSGASRRRPASRSCRRTAPRARAAA